MRTLLLPGISDSSVHNNNYIHKSVRYPSSKHTSVEEDDQIQINMSHCGEIATHLFSETHDRKAGSSLESVPFERMQHVWYQCKEKEDVPATSHSYTEQLLALKSSEFRWATSLRLGNTLRFHLWNCKCICGETCRWFPPVYLQDVGGRVSLGAWWKYSSRLEYCSCLQELKIHHKKEVQHHYCGKRQDIVVFDSGAESCSDLDIALARRWSGEAMRGSTTLTMDGLQPP